MRSLALLLPVVLFPIPGIGEFYCPPRPLCAELAGKAAFLGTVLSIDRNLSRVRLKVDEAFHGLPSGKSEVWLDPNWRGEDQGPNYQTGEKWLVVVSPQPGDPPFGESLCTASRRTDSPDVTQDVAMLRNYRDGGGYPVFRDTPVLFRCPRNIPRLAQK